MMIARTIDGTEVGSLPLTTLLETKVSYYNVYRNGGVGGHHESELSALKIGSKLTTGIIKITTTGDDFTVEKV